MDDLELHFKRFWKVVLELGQFQSGHPIPATISHTRTFTESGSKLSSLISRQSFLLLHNFISPLEQLPRVDDCLSVLSHAGLLVIPKKSNDQGQAIDDSAAVKRHLISQLLYAFSQGIDKYGHYQLTEDEISELLRELRRKTNPSEQERIITVPLKNFTMSEAPLFADGVELRAFTGQEKTTLWQTGSLDYSVPAEEFAQVGFRLAGRYRTGDIDGRFSIDNVINCFIDTLRLLKDGDVGALWSFDHGEPVLGSHQEFGSTEMSDHHVRSFGETYALLESDYPAFQGLFQSIRSLRKSGFLRPLEIGLRRFNQSYGRRTEEDKIIDWTIALENTLLADIEDELSYRLAIRGAALLSKHRDPQDVWKLLRCIYDVRSLIVHQGLRFTDKSVLKRIENYCAWTHFLNEAEALVRQILRESIARLEKGQSIEKVNEGLENQILNGLSDVK